MYSYVVSFFFLSANNFLSKNLAPIKHFTGTFLWNFGSYWLHGGHFFDFPCHFLNKEERPRENENNGFGYFRFQLKIIIEPWNVYRLILVTFNTLHELIDVVHAFFNDEKKYCNTNLICKSIIWGKNKYIILKYRFFFKIVLP